MRRTTIHKFPRCARNHDEGRQRWLERNATKALTNFGTYT